MVRNERKKGLSWTCETPDKSRFLTSVLLPERLAGQPCPALHLRHSSLSFSRVTSAHSPRLGKTPESVTPSASGTPLFSCALRLSYSVVEHTISHPPLFVNPRRTFIRLWRILLVFSPVLWAYLPGKFTIWSFFSLRSMLY